MNAIELSHINKSFGAFAIQDLNLTIPSGTICGLVGENGAGKSTTIRLLMGALRPDSGKAKVLGVDASAPDFREAKEDIGVVLDEAYFPETLNAMQVGKLMAHTYRRWDMGQYRQYLHRFELPETKLFKDFSRGMRMKLRLAAALAHHPRLLLLDEATSGLDPVMRAEILDLLRRFIQDEEHSVLLSSHITADLEKAADYIVYIQKGRILFEKETDLLLEEYGVLRAGAQQIAALPADLVVATRANAFGQAALVNDRRAAAALLPDAVLDKPTLDDIMQFYSERRSV